VGLLYRWLSAARGFTEARECVLQIAANFRTFYGFP
jgi:hypothetical protein